MTAFRPIKLSATMTAALYRVQAAKPVDGEWRAIQRCGFPECTNQTLRALERRGVIEVRTFKSRIGPHYVTECRPVVRLTAPV